MKAILVERNDHSLIRKFGYVVLVFAASLFFPISVLCGGFYLWYMFTKEEASGLWEYCCVCCLFPFVPVGAGLVLVLLLVWVATLQLGVLVVSGRQLYIIRMVENILVMIVITLFAFTDINCKYCADPIERSANNNERVMIWLIIGWASVAVHIFASYFVSKMIKPNYDFRWEKMIELITDMADSMLDMVEE